MEDITSYTTQRTLQEGLMWSSSSEERSQDHLKVDSGQLPVDPTDQVMFRLKLLEALIDMSRFLLACRTRTHTCTCFAKVKVDAFMSNSSSHLLK